MTINITTRLLFFLLAFTTISTFFSYVTYLDRLTPSAFAASPQANSTSNIADQIVQLKNIVSNQSSDIKEMKKFMSEEVQLLKSMGQEFDRTATQSSFAALGVFFLGLTLVIFGLKLTLKATDGRTSRYFRAMMLGLIIPVIVLLAGYQIGIPIYKAGDSFFFTSLLLFIPVGMIIFLTARQSKQAAKSIKSLIRILGSLIIIAVVISYLSENPALGAAIGTITGIVLGFAAQNVIGNLITGMYLTLARPFKIEDNITVLANL